MIEGMKFDEKGLIPVITQDVRTREVLMLAYMNRESLEITQSTRKATYFSRSRQELWEKGATSGNTQHVVDIRYDCDCDTLLLLVEQTGNACHTGEYSCFYRGECADIPGASVPDASVIYDVFDTIIDRKNHPKEGSYTNYLFTKGVEKICKKVGEEASESIIAAMKGSKDELRCEVSDLIYHLLVLLADMGLTPDDVFAELNGRKK